jgi:hypothetical protein
LKNSSEERQLATVLKLQEEDTNLKIKLAIFDLRQFYNWNKNGPIKTQGTSEFLKIKLTLFKRCTEPLSFHYLFRWFGL